jgi:SMI1 / KNR4 family (SUKH-1)
MAVRVETLEALVARIREVHDEFDVVRGEKPTQKLNAPATSAQIAGLEKALGVKLPKDYVALLRLHNGWENFHADYSLLSTEQMTRPGPMSKRIAQLKQLMQENPKTAKQDPIIILAGPYGKTAVYFDRSTAKRDGSTQVVEWDPAGEIMRHPSVTAYLQSYKSFLERMTEKERKRLR